MQVPIKAHVIITFEVLISLNNSRKVNKHGLKYKYINIDKNDTAVQHQSNVYLSTKLQ